MFHIRTANRDDIGLIQSLAREIWFAHYTAILSTNQIEYMLKLMYSADTIEHELSNGVLWEIAYMDNVPIGFISFAGSMSELNLKKIYFKPDFHGKGLGQKALIHVIEYAKINNIPKIVLTVNKKNQKAINAYEKAGFTYTESKIFDIGEGYVMDDYIYTYMVQNSEIPPPIYVVSGGKGLAGDSVVQSILIQFPDNKVPVIIVPDMSSPEKAGEVVNNALKSRGVIVHTMVNPFMRKVLTMACEENKVKHFDLVGDLSNYLENLLKVEPISKPGLYRLKRIDYFHRIEAIEFTLRHDDGQYAEKIDKADIILTGVSRTGKTPLSVYLAMFGWKVANVPLVPGIPPPESLFQVDKNRVFGLTISPNYLIVQRGNRVKTLQMADDVDYIDRRKVTMEIEYAERFFNQGGFTIINITNKPIESSANEILTILTDRFGQDRWTV